METDHLNNTYNEIQKYQSQLKSAHYQPDDSDLMILDDIKELVEKLTNQVENTLNQP